MELHNQTRNALNFSIGKHDFECEPYGAVTVPDHLVEFVRSRGLPLKTTPVAATERSAVRAAEAKKAAEADELIAARQDKTLAEDALAQAQKAVEESEKKAAERLKACEVAAETIEGLNKRIVSLQEEKDAMQNVIDEQAKQIADLESKLAVTPDPVPPEKKPAAKNGK